MGIDNLLIELLQISSAPFSTAWYEQVADQLSRAVSCREVRIFRADLGQLAWCDLASGTMRCATRLVEESETHWRQAPSHNEPHYRDSALVLPLIRGRTRLGVVEIEPILSNDFPCRDWHPVAQLLGVLLENAILQHRLEQEMPYLRETVKMQGDLRTLTGAGDSMKRVRLAIQQVAATDSTVLILGETGTGKELVAQAIHQLSARRDRLLVKVNCAALNPNILTSELFGHERGAFTGATKRRLGRFEMAQHGTIFLDEIAELPPATQVLLLRVLQERTIERVGGNEAIPVDVRIIAATHQDLAAAVKEGRFRADLFFRLNVFPIRVPPLRERKEDIADLVQHFIHVFNRRMNKQVHGIDTAGFAPLLNYSWPGNVRELENIIERMMIIAPASTLTPDPSWFASAMAGPAATGTLRDLERDSIVAALQQSNGRIYGAGGAAALLGLKPTTLYSKMRRLDISRSGAN